MITSLRSVRRRNEGFSTAELVVGIVLFTAATSGTLYMGKAMRDHRIAAISANEQNAYATFQSQVTLQGINPSLVTNPMAGAINQGGTISGQSTSGANLAAIFEQGAVTQATGAQRNLAGSVRVNALNYNVASAGNQNARGTGMGFTIETTGPAAPSAPNAIQLVPPVFQITGDLTQATFPIAVSTVALEPSTNPTGTIYRYTTDGSVPTGTSPVWDGQPDWTPDTFPLQVTLRAFNPDPQYAASGTVTATYTMQLTVTYARADGRSSNLYGFALADLSAPSATGIVLADNIDSFNVVYTLDGSDPTSSATATPYGGPFAPDQSLFPTVTLKVAAVSNDPRITSSAVTTYSLGADQISLSSPTFVTSNATPLPPGTPVVISVNGSNASPRTEVNNGAPSQSSSSGTSFPLN